MRVLTLVISDDSNPVYQIHREMWREGPKHPDIDVFFVECCLEIEKPMLVGDTFKTPGKEGPQALVRKTIDAFDYFLAPGHPYTWVVRTNITSHYHWPGLVEYLKTKNPVRYYGGYHGWYNGIHFVGGAGIYMTPDVCSILQENRKELYEVGVLDDVDIAVVLSRRQVYPDSQNAPRKDYHNLQDFDPNDCIGFHFRLKHLDNSENRVLHEPEIRRRLMATLLNRDLK